MILIVCLVRILAVPDFCYEIFNIPQHGPHAYDEFIVLLIQGVNVIPTVETAIHDQLNLSIAKDIQFPYQFIYGLHIRYISGELAVIEWQSRFLAE